MAQARRPVEGMALPCLNHTTARQPTTTAVIARKDAASTECRKVNHFFADWSLAIT